MAQRNSLHASQPPTIDHDQIRNHPLPDSQLHLDNGVAVLPMDPATNPNVLRPNDYQASHFPNYMAVNSGQFHDPYLRSSSTVSSSQFPPNHFFCLPPPSSNQNGSNIVNHQTEIERATFKRKSPAMPLFSSGGNPKGYYSAGSSSNLHAAPYPVRSIHPNPVAAQYWHMDSTSGIYPSYRNDNTFEEVSQRNVRSRNNHTLQIGTNPAVVAYSPSTVPCHIFEVGSSSSLSTRRQLSDIQITIAPQVRIASSDASFSYDAEQPLARPSCINHVARSNTSSTLSTHHEPFTGGLGFGHNGYNQRSNNYGLNSSCPPMRNSTVTLEAPALSGLDSVASSGYSRPSTSVGHNNYRNGRRNSRWFQSFYDGDSSRSRWPSEGVVLMNRSTLYDSQNLFDHHSDMRLDIDNMSYEELLALGERIGNVNTGLSEDKISECLQERSHCSSNQHKDDDQDEGRCVICLEGYKNQEKLGRLRCYHDFHASCIRKWLLVKNACPICKGATSGDTSKD